MQWRSRLEAVLNGKAALRPEEVSSAHECDFGKWYFGAEGQALRSYPSFEEVGQLHAQVHQHAGRIAELAAQGRKDQARKLMEEFEQVRERFFTALDELYLG